jgi:hypothetical protein
VRFILNPSNWGNGYENILWELCGHKCWCTFYL